MVKHILLRIYFAVAAVHHVYGAPQLEVGVVDVNLKVRSHDLHKPQAYTWNIRKSTENVADKYTADYVMVNGSLM